MTENINCYQLVKMNLRLYASALTLDFLDSRLLFNPRRLLILSLS